MLCPTASVIPSSLVCCHPSDRRAQSFTEQMCVLLIATSAGSYFTWIPFLFVCFLSSWPQPVSVSLPFKASLLCMLVLRKGHIHALWNVLKTGHWAGRYVVIVFPETNYTSCTHPMTSWAVPTKIKLPILSTLLPHWRWRLMQSFSFLLEETLYLLCPAGFAAGLICWPHAGADVAVQALILCAFQSIMGNFEAVHFLRWHFRVCRLTFISMSFAHCSSIHLALHVDQKDAEIQEDIL